MSDIAVHKITDCDRTVCCPPDKSVSVRAVILGAAATGVTAIENLSDCDDVKSALSCVMRLGAKVDVNGGRTYIEGLGGKRYNGGTLDCGNSALTARLLAGLLSGVSGEFTLTGDDSLRSRPMLRVIDPLVSMGARIEHENGRLPITITGGELCGIDYELPVASAQVKSAILLAGLNAAGRTRVTESVKTRDHTEAMLSAMGASVTVDGLSVSVERSVPRAIEISVAGDASAAVYPLCLALMTGGRCEVRGVDINPTRTEYLRVLEDIGAKISVNARGGVADIIAERGATELKPFDISGERVAKTIDELPALCALACFIGGVSAISGAEELRVKESDRIKNTVAALCALGADATETRDGIVVRGGDLSFGTVDPLGDHRIAMSAAIAAAAGNGGIIKNGGCVSVSYPHFYDEVLDV